MSKESISGRNLSESITSDDILGKEVIDVEGKFIGVVEKIMIDPVSLNLIGVEVDKGFLKHGFAVGKSYISRVTKHALLLNIKLMHELKGFMVYDKFGKKIGKISGVELHGHKNKIKVIHVKSSLFKKEIIVPASLVKTFGDNVILKISKEELK